jgi:small subunit ribosomal protein S5
MAEILDEATALESTTVGVFRTSATIKGGRRFSFSALVVVGDRSGRVGVGYAKANQVPPAIEKAQKDARRRMKQYPMVGRTLPHEVTGCYGSCRVRILPASPGTGVIAGSSVRAPLEMMGVQDCLTKATGSTNPKNLVKAVIDGLSRLRSKQMVQQLRGVELGSTVVEEVLERGAAFVVTRRTPTAASGADRGDRRRGRGEGRGKPRGGGGGGGGGRRPRVESPEGSGQGEGGAAPSESAG